VLPGDVVSRVNGDIRKQPLKKPAHGHYFVSCMAVYNRIPKAICVGHELTLYFETFAGKNTRCPCAVIIFGSQGVTVKFT